MTLPQHLPAVAACQHTFQRVRYPLEPPVVVPKTPQSCVSQLPLPRHTPSLDAPLAAAVEPSAHEPYELGAKIPTAFGILGDLLCRCSHASRLPWLELLKLLILTLGSRLQRHRSYVPPIARQVATVESLLSRTLEQFVQFYYETFDKNRPGLAALYVCDSL